MFSINPDPVEYVCGICLGKFPEPFKKYAKCEHNLACL